MQITITIAFFLFLLGVTIWIFRMWLSEVKRWPVYRNNYHQSLKQLIHDEEINAKQVINSALEASLGLVLMVFGAITWLITGYVSVAGLILSGIYIYSRI